jgi:hypothetical protein
MAVIALHVPAAARPLPDRSRRQDSDRREMPVPDSLGYNEYIGAVAAIVSQHLEETLTRRFSLEWTARDDGHGFEIKGIG